MKCDTRRLVGGFSLVEVSLALLVMAVGILSVMSMFPAGLDQNVRSINDTHAAFFAEEVFAGLAVQAQEDWENLHAYKAPVAAKKRWGTDSRVDPIEFTLSYVTNVYFLGDYEDHALRYRLMMTTNESGLVKRATLWILPGEFGSTNDPSVFHCEYFRWKP